MPQRFLKNSTVKVAEVLQMAIMEVANLQKSVVISEFILTALIEQRDSIVLKIFDELRLDTNQLRSDIQERAMAAIQSIADLKGQRTGHMQVAQEVQNLFQAADRERREMQDGYISTGAMFLACFDESAPGTRKILTDLGLDLETCRAALMTLRGNQKITQKDGESRQSVLDEYTTDVTAQARRGDLDPVIGREQEIAHVIQILSRRKKNNPILIGEPGVGKTVIVEGLANQIAAADVPEYLLHKRILSLEMGSLIAGAKMQGEFEERLKTIKEEVIASAGDIILFIDELHTVVGAGRSGGGLDASNMLKPALARGLLQCIGATTTREYKQYIESDKALARRFQSVKVEQPSVEQTVKMLQGLKPKYEAHHQIEYSDEALVAAAELSDRYVPERFLPDKAIDLIDEAGAIKRLKIIYTPPEVRSLETKRHEFLNKKAQAFESQDFEKMATYQMELSQVEHQLSEHRAKLAKNYSDEERIVTEEDIAAQISKITGIPANKMIAEEADRLKKLEEQIERRVIGQSHAVRSVADAIRRNRAGLRKAGSPIASFLFLGPTGVGKTELAKAIAAEVMGDENKIIRVDMSEFMERHEVAKLIGSPPGYVGYGEGGQLTERVRNNPYSVVLFDEFEKAHPDVFNLLLQMLDEGWLTDAEGTKVSFQNCVIIGTSNIGSEILTDRKRPVGLGAQSEEWDAGSERAEVMKEVRRFLRPEFVNRLDELIIFRRLEMPELRQILQLQLDDLGARLEALGHSLQVSDEAKDKILAGIDTTNFGARPLRRKIAQLIENRVASLLIEGGDQSRQVQVGLAKDEIVVNLKKA